MDTDKEPLVILVFDEAHSLTSKEETQVTDFLEMQYALRGLLFQPLFTLFLSTTGKLTQFIPLKHADPSNRIVSNKLHLIEPFTDLDFDIFSNSENKKGDDDFTLEEVTQVDHMMTLGRPL